MKKRLVALALGSLLLALWNIYSGAVLRLRVISLKTRLAVLEASDVSTATTARPPRHAAVDATAATPPLPAAAIDGVRIREGDMGCDGDGREEVCRVVCTTRGCSAATDRCAELPSCAAVSFNCVARTSLVGCVGTLKTYSAPTESFPSSAVVVVRVRRRPVAAAISTLRPGSPNRPVVTVLAWDRLDGFVDWTQPAFVRDARALCRATECRFTTSRAEHSTADGVLFHWPTREGSMPTKRADGTQPWVMMYLESGGDGRPWPRAQMDLLSTFALDSDVPLTYFSPQWSLDAFLKKELPLHEKRGNLGGAGTQRALATAFISNCAKERTPYLLELMQHLAVHNFGSCHGNAKEPGAEGRDANANKEWVAARYPFHLAFENDRAGHYVTEKLFNALSSGSLPVYWGSKSVSDIVPFQNSFIKADDFASPQALAEYMRQVAADPALYASFFAWKEAANVTPKVRAAFEAVVDMSAYKYTSMCR